MISMKGRGGEFIPTFQSLPVEGNCHTPAGVSTGRSVLAFAPLSRARRDYVCDTCNTLATPCDARCCTAVFRGFRDALEAWCATPPSDQSSQVQHRDTLNNSGVAGVAPYRIGQLARCLAHIQAVAS